MTSLYATITPHFTQELLSPGLQVGYVDDGGVWQFLAPSLALRLPLRAIEWKNLVGVTQTIDRLPLHFVNEPSGAGVSMPLVCVYVIKCEDMERYKATVKAQIAQWIDRMNAARVDWMLLYVPLGTRAKRGSVSGGGMGPNGGASSIYKKIFERIKTDFGNKKNASISGGMGASSIVVGGATSSAAGNGSGSINESSRSGGVSMAGLSNLGSSLAGTISGGGGANGVSVDRICKIDTLEGASVVGAQATNETQWTELLLKMRKCIMEAFQCKCLQYEEEVRVLDAKRSLPNWDFGAFFVAKERLALMYQQTCLLDDAIRHLDELDAIFQFLVENDRRYDSTPDSQPAVSAADPIFSVSSLAIDMPAMHKLIAAGQAPPLLMRLYFFSRQIRTLYLKGDFRQLIQRATSFISSFHLLLTREQEKSCGEIKWFQPHLWAVGACLEIAYACELSWSGHDYQISSASIPEGVSFALTPEVMAGLLGDILYLARRILKKSARSNGWWVMAPSDVGLKENFGSSGASALEERSRTASGSSSQSSNSSWYHSLQAMFEADTPDHFQRCVWELSHLASLHFSRAGRHRFAVFLGSECARYHFRHREFESASRLFRSHARQCEEDKWWSLMSESVRRICDSELALGRSAQAVAACFSMLEIAQASKAEVSRAYLDQLLTSLVQSLHPSADGTVDGVDGSDLTTRSSAGRVKMGELIRPAMVIETMQSPESDLDYGDVRVTLSLTNQFPAGIHIECVRIRFTRWDDSGATEEEGNTVALDDINLTDDPPASPMTSRGDTSQSDEAQNDSLVDLEEHNVYLYERASVNLIFLYGDVDVGRYKCTGLDCTVAGNSFPLFSRHELDSIQFTIPPRKSTLEMQILGPPILSPANLEEVHIVIQSEDDVVHHGMLEIALPDDCSLVSISHAVQHSEQHTPDIGSIDQREPSKKFTLSISDLPAKTAVRCSVWLIVEDTGVTDDMSTRDEDTTEADPRSPPVVVLAAALRYDAGTLAAKRHTELRRCERVFQVTRPLVESVRLQRVDATRVFAAVALTCNAECGVRICDYALDCSPAVEAETEHGPNDDVSTARLRVTMDPNAHVRGHRLGRNETLHMTFGLELDSTGQHAVALPDHVALRIALAFDHEPDAPGEPTWRTTSRLALPLRAVDGAVYEIDVRPKAARAGSWSAGEEVSFTVRVARVHPCEPKEEERLLLCLAPASDADWILLGKQREALRDGAVATTKRLLPLRVGRLPFPQFALQRADAAAAEPSARVFSAQRAMALPVV